MNHAVLLSVKRAVPCILTESKMMRSATHFGLIEDICGPSVGLKGLAKGNVTHVQATHEVGLLVFNAFTYFDILPLDVDLVR